ncbi:MAG: hypothetical protein AAGH72_06185 [Verrucomicrobiota bacterium]
MAVAKKSPRKQSAPKEKNIHLDVRHEPVRKVLFCNKFAIEADGENRLLVFLFQSRTGDIYDSYSTVVTGQDMMSLKDNWLDYLGQIGMELVKDADYQVNLRSMPIKISTIESSNFVRLGRVGNVAEFRFFNFPISRMLDRGEIAPKSSGVETTFLALVRCDLSLQIQFLAALFENEVEN